MQGQGNKIALKFFGIKSYVGNIYIGSNLAKLTIKFDTRTKWTGVILNGVIGAPPSSFKVRDSLTAEPIISEATDEAEVKSLAMDLVKYDGNLYRDQMCLNMLNEGGHRRMLPGGLCVRK